MYFVFVIVNARLFYFRNVVLMEGHACMAFVTCYIGYIYTVFNFCMNQPKRDF